MASPTPTEKSLPEGIIYLEGVNVVTVAGTGEAGREDGPAKKAKLSKPWSLVVDAKNTVYFTGEDEYTVRRISPDGIVTTIAGTGVPGFVDGPANRAQFAGVRVEEMSKDGTLYLTDMFAVRVLTPDGSVRTLTGTKLPNYLDGTLKEALFSTIGGMASDGTGKFFVTQPILSTIRLISVPDNMVKTLNKQSLGAFADGPLADAKFAFPLGLALDAAGNVYVADAHNQRIRKITLDGIVSTVAGNWKSTWIDGQGEQASFCRPTDVVVDESGALYVADEGCHVIRKIRPDGTVITVAGVGIPGYRDGPGDQAMFDGPYSLALGPDGNLYVADRGNNRIRKILLP